MLKLEYRLKPLRKADIYTIAGHIAGLVVLKGQRSIGSFHFKTGRGKFWSKDNFDCSLDKAPAYEYPQDFVDQCIALLGDRLDPTKTTFVFTHDPGHGWLGVPVWLIEELKVQPSPYSYISTDHLIGYLEEDLDLDKFIQAYTAKYGKPPEYQPIYDEKTFIRNCPRYPRKEK